MMTSDKDWAKFKRDTRRNRRILDAVYPILRPILKKGVKIEFQIEDGEHPSMRIIYPKKPKRTREQKEGCNGKCAFDPTIYAGMPIGMFHCPSCGEMVVAGMEHPDYSADERFRQAVETAEVKRRMENAKQTPTFGI